jgi:hypothetical protein
MYQTMEHLLAKVIIKQAKMDYLISGMDAYQVRTDSCHEKTVALMKIW